ncbi:MAG TPA: hypothetical protein VNZ61_21055 [Roseomonas sp.]|nr:hypothetical protein [Roseomonas sp.]
MSGGLLARLEAAGATLRHAPDGTLRLRPSRPLPPDLLAEARARRSDLAILVADREADDAEREAIRTEPELPPLGSPEWDRLDRQQRAMVAGLLQASRRYLPLPDSLPHLMNLQEPSRDRRR